MRLGKVAMAFLTGSQVEYWYLKFMSAFHEGMRRVSSVRVLCKQFDHAGRVNAFIDDIDGCHRCRWGGIVCKSSCLEYM